MTNSSYELEDSWVGNEFINGNKNGNKWLFFEKDDPTHGYVAYGKWDQLISFADNKIRIDVESKGYDSTENRQRKAIRLYTEKQFNGGLFIIDLDHIPEGLAVWPAIWLNGQGATWPENGEIDIIEGVNSTPTANNQNQSTLHTKPGCVQNVPGILSPDCGASGGFNGCGLMGPERSFGNGFNQDGGGAYACEWLYDQTIRIWFWKREDIPANVLTDSPDPKMWGEPYAGFSPFPGYFKNMEMIINTTLCGDWAGRDFPGGGHSACGGYVWDANNNPKFEDAYFLIRSVRIFKSGS